MQGMDRDEYHIVVLVKYLDLLLITVCLRDTDQPAEPSDTVIHMHHIISDAELLQFLQGECHPAVTDTLTPKVIFVETVEYLMVCEETTFEQSVA